MGFAAQFIRHPQQMWVRRANLQVHLWTGIILAVYAVVIGLTGSILVFGAELTNLVDPKPWPQITATTPTADLAQIVDILKVSYPRVHIISIMAPTKTEPVFIAVLLFKGRTIVALHPVTGQLLGEIQRRRSRIDWIYNLHEDLLARRTGRVVNAAGAGCLLLLIITGLVNWWPGIKHWPRALRIDFRRKWRRVNFDIHSAFGFWSIAFLIVWSISGIYFTWPQKFLLFIDQFSPIVNSQPPSMKVEPQAEITRLDFHDMVAKSLAVDAGSQWEGIIFPSSRRSPFQVLMLRSPGIGRDNEDTVYFNPYNGEYISTWQYGVNKSLGDWLIWLQIPLHFGTHWGLTVKFVWATFGLALPVLAVSGLLMYWNRVLSKRWNRLK